MRVVDSTGDLGKADHVTQLGAICKPAEGALDPTVCVIGEDIK